MAADVAQHSLRMLLHVAAAIAREQSWQRYSSPAHVKTALLRTVTCWQHHSMQPWSRGRHQGSACVMLPPLGRNLPRECVGGGIQDPTQTVL